MWPLGHVGHLAYSFINMLFISTGIFDDKLHPQILSVGTTANAALISFIYKKTVKLYNCTGEFIVFNIWKSLCNDCVGSILHVCILRTIPIYSNRFVVALAIFKICLYEGLMPSFKFFNFSKSDFNLFLYTPQRSCRGVYWFHHVRPSVDKSYVIR